MTKPFRDNRLLQVLVVWLIVLWTVTAINPLYRQDWLLENILVFFFSAVLCAGYSRFRFSNTSYLLLALFMSLHLAGAHYTYAETPFGFWLQDWFDLQRNHYDRIVHFSFGLFIALPLQEMLLRLTGIKRSWSYFMAVTLVLAFSACYEIMEAAVAVIVQPELGSAYLGTQGDEWDAQKDSALAALGSVVAMAFAAWYQKFRSHASD